jgi:glycosyltransferase involved in cell wall biosynthesis
MTRVRPRIGIFDLSESHSGLTRYVNGILDVISGEEFDVTVFCHPRNPYTPRPDVRFFPIPGLTPPPAAAPSGGQPSEVSPDPVAGSTLSRLWRSLAPSDVRYAVGYARMAARIARHLRSEPVDVLHTNECGCMQSVLAARLARVPRVIATYHTTSVYDRLAGRLTPGYRMLEQATNRLLDRAIAVSDSTRLDRVRHTRIPGSRVVTIHNGVDPDEFDRLPDVRTARASLGLPGDRLILGAVGQLQPYKGFDVLIRAFAALAGDHPDVNLAVAGSGPQQEELEFLAGQLGVRSRVHFLGFQANVPLVLAALDVYVLSSRCEALPYALLEAMAAKRPVVATTVGGVAEVIEAGVSGLLVPPGRVGALSENLRHLVRSESTRTRIGTAARERVVRYFHQRDSAQQTIEVYRQLLNPTATIRSDRVKMTSYRVAINSPES